MLCYFLFLPFFSKNLFRFSKCLNPVHCWQVLHFFQFFIFHFFQDSLQILKICQAGTRLAGALLFQFFCLFSFLFNILRKFSESSHAGTRLAHALLCSIFTIFFKILFRFSTFLNPVHSWQVLCFLNFLFLFLFDILRFSKYHQHGLQVLCFILFFNILYKFSIFFNPIHGW